jgi:hypothetical protein
VNWYTLWIFVGGFVGGVGVVLGALHWYAVSCEERARAACEGSPDSEAGRHAAVVGILRTAGTVAVSSNLVRVQCTLIAAAALAHGAGVSAGEFVEAADVAFDRVRVRS